MIPARTEAKTVPARGDERGQSDVSLILWVGAFAFLTVLALFAIAIVVM